MTLSYEFFLHVKYMSTKNTTINFKAASEINATEHSLSKKESVSHSSNHLTPRMLVLQEVNLEGKKLQAGNKNLTSP